MIEPDRNTLLRCEMHQGNELIMRLGLGMTIYLPRPFKEVRTAVLQCWRELLQLAGPGCFKWVRLGGGNRSRAFDNGAQKTIDDWLSGRKNYGDTCWISVHDGPFDAIGEWAFMATGHDAPADDPDVDAGHIQVVVPLALLKRMGPDALAGAFFLMVSHFPGFLAGSAGYLLHRSPYKFNTTIEQMGALSERFLSVEIGAAERLAYIAPQGVPTVNWLTFVGNPHLVRMGGRLALMSSLDQGFDVRDLPGGLAIRAGKEPGLGDRHDPGNDETRLLRKLSERIRPAQAFDLPLEFHGVRFDVDRTTEYLQRFLR